MPCRSRHLAFDEILVEEGIIAPGRNTSVVHARLDDGARRFGPAHRELDPYHNPGQLRVWVSSIVGNLGTMHKDTATDCIRVGCGHVVLDRVVSDEEDRIQKETGKRPGENQLNWKKLYKEALRVFRRCGFHRSYYKGSNRDVIEQLGDFVFGSNGLARA